MLERKIYGTLLDWKNTKHQECLTVVGARQIGKTYIIEKFGKENYSSYIYINFLKNSEYKRIFASSMEPSEIYKNISLTIAGADLIPGNTLIFLDEIQACRNARTALKFLAIDESYDVITSGSLLGLKYNAWDDEGFENTENYSVPVGYERELEMFSLDFEEFLWAMHYSKEAIDILKTSFLKKSKIDDVVNQKYLKLFREYMIIGGMPKIVQTYVETDDFQKVFSEQQTLLREYARDIEHYARNTDKAKISRCYESIPRQLARENKKFTYSLVENGGKARKYKNSIDWLIDAGMVKKLNNVSVPMLPLKAYEKPEEFKLYVTDIGILTAMFGKETQKALLEDKLKGPAKGGIYENLVFDVLMKKKYSLFYYKKENSEQEIDFLIEQEGESVPIEVKSKNGDTPSLNTFLEEYNPQLAYKLISGNLSLTNTSKIVLPLYMAMFI